MGRGGAEGRWRCEGGKKDTTVIRKLCFYNCRVINESNRWMDLDRPDTRKPSSVWTQTGRPVLSTLVTWPAER